MTSQTTKQLVLNITTTDVWTALLDLSTGSAYVVGAGARCDVKWLRSISLGANLATVEFAISVDNTPPDQQRIIAPTPLTNNESLFDDSGCMLPEGFGLWGRATGTTPNVTFGAFGLEIGP